eukprot:Selendium_serpulae@DN5607_c0_g2_i2.p1
MTDKKARDTEKVLLDRIRAFQRKTPLNKRCADCTEIGPTYVCMDYGTFICTMCSGLHRELCHKVKGVSVSKWSPAEVEFIEKHGNEVSRAIYMSSFNSKDAQEPDASDPNVVRKFLRTKYVDKLWCQPDPSKGWGRHKEESDGETPTKKVTPKKEHKKKKPRDTEPVAVAPATKPVSGDSANQAKDDWFASFNTTQGSAPPWDAVAPLKPSEQPDEGWAAFDDPSTCKPTANAGTGWETVTGLEAVSKGNDTLPFDPFKSDLDFGPPGNTPSTQKDLPLFNAVLPKNDVILSNSLNFDDAQPPTNQRYSGDPFQDIIDKQNLSDASPAMSLPSTHESGLSPQE